MKVLIYSAKDFEIPFLEKENSDQFQVKYTPERLTVETAQLALGFDVVSIFSADDGSSKVLEQLKDFGIGYIALRSTGYDNVNLNKANKLGIRVANAPGYSPYAIAEHAITLLQTLNRKILVANQQVNQYNFSLSNLVGFDLNNKTVGIVGTGRIGKVIAKIVHGFGCNIIATDVCKDQSLMNEYDVTYMDLMQLTKQSDIIFLSIPLTSETHHLIDTSIIAHMKPGVILINIARGSVVNTKDVIQALKLGRIAAYGADVYEEESGVFFYDRSKDKPKDEVLQELINLPNVLLTPHQAFATNEALTNIAKTTLDSVRSWSLEEPAKNELTMDLVR